jgi:hypothetical protein
VGACCNLKAADADLDHAIGWLAHMHVDLFARRHVSCGAGELLQRLRNMPEVMNRDHLIAEQDRVRELQKVGCLSASHLEGKSVSVRLRRERIVELGRNTARRVLAWHSE